MSILMEFISRCVLAPLFEECYFRFLPSLIILRANAKDSKLLWISSFIWLILHYDTLHEIMVNEGLLWGLANTCILVLDMILYTLLWLNVVKTRRLRYGLMAIGLHGLRNFLALINNFFFS